MNLKFKTYTAQVNRLGYLVPPDDLQEILFPGQSEDITSITKAKIENGLSAFGLELPKMEPYSITIPEIKESPEEVLEKALVPFKECKAKIEKFLDADIDLGLPTVATIRNNLNSGWTRFKNGEAEAVEYPLEGVGILDVETYVKAGGWPVMAGCVTAEAMYIWLHPSLVSQEPFTKSLIPVGSGKILINHNIGYDAARLEEAYDQDITLVDTMSMHIAVNGMGNQQRKAFATPFKEKWKNYTSPNSLKDCYNFHVNPLRKLTEDDKAIRDIFVVGHIDQFKINLIDLIRYCLRDCTLTFELARVVWPKYIRYNPKDFTLAGHILVNSALLPVVENWDEWKEDTSKQYRSMGRELKANLTDLAKSILHKTDEEIASDPWLSQLDWTRAKTGKNKGAPLWYRKNYLSKVKKLGKNPIGVSSNLAPILLRMSWKGAPLFYHPTKKWCFICDPEYMGSFQYIGKTLSKVPHPKGDKNNCGSPLSKDYIKLIKSGVLSSESPEAQRLMETAKSLSYWKSMQGRVFQDLHVMYKGKSLIKPQMTAHGTITRRAVQKTWLTCSDIKPKVLGSELKSRVQAPKGCVLVGADFSQQEMRIGAAKADSFFQVHGSSPMSLTQMVGDKDKGTDSHSLLAKVLGVWPDRQLAKTLNFLMLFFGGVAGLFEAIKTNRPDLADSEANGLATKALKLRRGTKSRETSLFYGGTDSHAYNYMIKLANTKENRTVLGNSAISECLQKDNCNSEYMPSRCNRSIQSAGADILHLFLTFLHYFISEWKIQAQYVISIHDENWCMVPEDQAQLLAWAFELSHVYTWSLFFKAYGFDTIPFNYMFFDSVNIDKVLRKEVFYAGYKDDKGNFVYTGTKTISNPNEEIPEGRSLKVANLKEESL